LGDITTFLEQNWDTLSPPHKNSSWKKILSSQLSSSSIFESIEEDEILFSIAKSTSQDSKLFKKKQNSKISINSSPEKNTDRSYLWCHQCKQKHDYVFYCTRNCSKKYCTRCVQRHYHVQIEDINISHWVCYYCQGVCSCASCRRRRAKETNTKFESHRGKKRRSADDESAPTKKRKLKLEGSNSDKDPDTKSKDEISTIMEDLNGVIEQTPRRKLLRKRTDEKRLQNSLNTSITSETCSRKSGMVRRRVTLKDLIDSHILSSGDELSFRNSDELAILLQDGQILWSDTTFKSLSTFAKSVAHLVGAGTKGALYNGWRVVYCRGKVMDSYRKKYERTIENRKTDEIEESSDSKSEEDNSPEDDEPESGPDSEDPKMTPIKLETDQPNTDQEGSSSGTFINVKGEESNKEKSSETTTESWWCTDSDSEYDLDQDPYNFGSPILFGIYDSYSPLHLEEEQDLLIMGKNDIFLDIRDKDFFNMVSAEDCTPSMVSHSPEGDTNANGVLIYSSRNESVEDFYNGFDCDY